MTNRFRKEYRELSNEEMELSSNIKNIAEILEGYINKAPDGREQSLAMTKLEEAVMWAIKSVTG